MDYSKIDFDTWMEIGLRQGFVGPPVCISHDGLPTTAEEDELIDEEDICIHVIRPYRSVEERLAVETNHAPTMYRNPLYTNG